MSDDPHLAATGRAQQGIHLIDFSYHFGPAFGEHIIRAIFGDERIRRLSPSLTDLPPMGVGVKAVVADHVLADSLCFAPGLRSDLAVD
jgi:hypothetical protein